MSLNRITCTVFCCAAALVLPASASAATRANVLTGPAKLVSYASATATGTIYPNGSNTAYYVQYGPTRAYGSQSVIGEVPATDKSATVSVPLAGLAPLTEYHYRLVAVNAGGVAAGDDRTFVTTRVPLSLAILASPNPVAYGGAVTVQGTLSGTGNAGRAVVLQADPFPYTGGFQNATNPQLTSATGSFSFPLLGVIATTQYRVVTSPAATVVSPVAVVGVSVSVTSHVHRVSAHRARIYGTVTPAETGAQYAILRVVHGHGVLVAGGFLVAHGTSSSSYSRTLRVKRGVYRVLVRLVNAPQISSYGTPFLIG